MSKQIPLKIQTKLCYFYIGTVVIHSCIVASIKCQKTSFEVLSVLILKDWLSLSSHAQCKVNMLLWLAHITKQIFTCFLYV